MNYIAQIRSFWRSHEEHSFTTTEIALYFHLLEVSNLCQWKNPFKRNNAKIQVDLGISFNTLKNARNKLQQCGLIHFQSRSGSSTTIYTLSKSDEVTAEVTIEVSSEVGKEVPCEVSPAKDKLNKTKLNKTKEMGLSSSEDNMCHCRSDSRTPPVSSPLPDLSIDYHSLVRFFNDTTQGVFGCIRYPLSAKRKSSIRARVLEHGKEAFAEMITRATQSNFLKGDNRRGFRATFDWMILPSNFQKILEGNYENRITTPPNANSAHRNIDQQFFEHIRQGVSRARFAEQQQQQHPCSAYSRHGHEHYQHH
jgi:hypothetical protein